MNGGEKKTTQKWNGENSWGPEGSWGLVGSRAALFYSTLLGKPASQHYHFNQTLLCRFVIRGNLNLHMFFTWCGNSSLSHEVFIQTRMCPLVATWATFVFCDEGDRWILRRRQSVQQREDALCHLSLGGVKNSPSLWSISHWRAELLEEKKKRARFSLCCSLSLLCEQTWEE